jgi:NADH:ubiquinone oxidoreductase subunit 4 (subunit M)
MYSYWQIYREVWRTYSPKQKGWVVALALILLDRMSLVVGDVAAYLFVIIWRGDAVPFYLLVCMAGYATYRRAHTKEIAALDDPDFPGTSSSES